MQRDLGVGLLGTGDVDPSSGVGTDFDSHFEAVLKERIPMLYDAQNKFFDPIVFLSHHFKSLPDLQSEDPEIVNSIVQDFLIVNALNQRARVAMDDLIQAEWGEQVRDLYAELASAWEEKTGAAPPENAFWLDVAQRNERPNVNSLISRCSVVQVRLSYPKRKPMAARTGYCPRPPVNLREVLARKTKRARRAKNPRNELFIFKYIFRTLIEYFLRVQKKRKKNEYITN